jgi:hypothetical protein
MATAFDHMAPFQRLNYWLKQRIGELKEEIRLLDSELRMWADEEVKKLCSVHYFNTVAIREIEVRAELTRLHSELKSWEDLLTDTRACTHCGGYGKIRVVVSQDESESYTCPVCNGTGKALQTQGV